jgi:hypothetical protein
LESHPAAVLKAIKGAAASFGLCQAVMAEPFECFSGTQAQQLQTAAAALRQEIESALARESRGP